MSAQRLFRYILALVLFLAVAGGAQAQSAGPAVWEVQHGEATLVIMGSVHLLRPDATWLHPEIERRFDEASELILEVADLKEAEAVMMRVIQDKGFYPPGQSLADDLSPQLYERVLTHADNLGAPRTEFARMRPWLAGIVLMQLWAANKGYDPGLGVDMHFSRRAAATGKRVSGLETVEEQLEMLVEGLGSDAESMLEQTLVQLENGDYMDSLITAWIEGDMTTLEELILGAFADFPEAYDVLIAERNRQWVERLDARLATPGSDFVVVGAGHLVGPDNVIELLEARGYTVTRH
jgi:uncharacterized protein